MGRLWDRCGSCDTYDVRRVPSRPGHRSRYDTSGVKLEPTDPKSLDGLHEIRSKRRFQMSKCGMS